TWWASGRTDFVVEGVIPIRPGSIPPCYILVATREFTCGLALAPETEDRYLAMTHPRVCVRAVRVRSLVWTTSVRPGHSVIKKK
ncbi:unnamed protein product, partial [Arabidopsis halleri]